MDGVYGVWHGSLAELVSYRYVGCQSVMTDRAHARGWTTVRSHLCSEGSVLGSVLAISMLDTAGINVDPIYLLALTQIDVQLYEPGLDVQRYCTIGSVVREARTQVFTECRFEDADRPGHVIGAGAANWTVVAPTQPGFEYTDPGPGFEEGPGVPAITTAYELEPMPSGGFVLPELSPRVGADTLHHGPVLVGLEQAAIDAAGDRSLALRSMSARILKAGRHAPFVFGAEVLTEGGDVVASRSQIVDAVGDTIAVALFAHQRGG
ncbi:MAG: hypothetical protein AB7Q42_12990 [Acidimicrobiia bacterium]